jgi:tetratricopeptide (TPR) repeat protein
VSNLPDLLQTAVAAHQTGRLAEAETLYRQILERVPEDPDTLFLLGSLALQTARPEAAARWIRQAISATAEDVPAEYHYNLGLAYAGMGQAADAAEHFRRAIAVAPDFVEAHNSLGSAMRELDRREEATEHYRRAIALAPEYVLAHTNLAAVLRESGRFGEAIVHARRAKELDPSDAEAHASVAKALAALGQDEEALSAGQKAIALAPNRADFYMDLGGVLARLGRLADSERTLRRALELAPDHVGAQFALGSVFEQAGRFEEAEACYRQGLDVHPDSVDVHVALARVLEAQRRLDEAERTLKRALTLNPRNAFAHLVLGELHAAEGRFGDAEQSYREALHCLPQYAGALLNLANIKHYTSLEDTDAQAIDALLVRPDIAESDAACLHFARAKICNDCGAHEEAFRHYREGNALKHRSSRFDRGKLEAQTERVLRTFDRAFFERRPGYGLNSERPVFVVGMARSGTSLVEQIIASHPLARGAGELTKIADLITAFERTAGPYPESAATLDVKTSRQLAAAYESHLCRAAGSDTARLTDKMPTNFMHLGFIALLFPHAHIVHCLRDPLDTCLSIYFQYFHHGNDYAYDLGEIGFFYRQYQRLMDHWREVLPIPIHEVRYEDLVVDPEGQVRALIAFLGLPWDERCLAHHRSQHAVQTASAWQVRQPIYSSAIGRWQHYEKHLEPLKQALELENR